MSCIACGRDLHYECLKGLDDKCCCKGTRDIEVVEPRSGNYKDDDAITISAGRKRAAVEYKIYPEKDCEWRFKADCGGGLFPVVGCLNGKQANRHHGPVKDTSRNEPNNVHLICANCHNEWHAKNDEKYNEIVYNELPHKPRPMTAEEMLGTR